MIYHQLRRNNLKLACQAGHCITGSQLEMLRQRGEQNGLTGIRRLSKTEITEVEPHCTGIDGLFVPQTGIVDYGAMTMRLAERIQNFGGRSQPVD